MTLNMDDPVPLKKRRTEGVHDKKSSNGGVTKEKSRSASEIVAVSLKLDKLQKLKQRIATSCKEKNQNPKPDDEFVISSVGSSPSSSPRSNYLAALSKSVDPFELHARLASLAQQDESLKSSEEDASINVVKMHDGKTPINKSSGHETADAEVQKKKDVSTSGSISKEELYAVLQKLVNEKCKKIEEKYVEKIIPDLERKISALEVENKRLSEHSNQLQEKLSKVEYEQKKPSETARIDVAVQAGFPLPPSLTSVSHTIHVTSPQVGKSALLVSEADVSNKQPAMTVLQTFSPVISAPPPYLARSPTGKTNPSRYLSSGSYVLTTAAGEPRLYSDAPYKQVSRQNTGIQRTQTPTIQPTATVRPQPQNLQASPSTLVAHRGPPPLPLSSNRITFNSQGPMVHTQAQPHGRYIVNQVTGDLRGLPPHRVPQMREVNSRPVTIANTSHVGGSRPNLIHSGSLTAGHIPVNPPPLVRAQTHMYSRAPVNNAQRYALRQRPPYHPVPDTRPQTRHTTPFSHPSAPTSHPQASLNVRPNGQPPPKPTVSISGAANGIVLSWDMFVPQECAPIDSYQLYACQDHNQGNSSKITWKKLGIVKALPLPMACTLTQFVSGCTYYFSVRAIDVHGRSGEYSTPRAITLPRENEKEQT
ncbi:activating transcription factor 7-interacting protein 1-like isoform X2 [Xenia sp. Carnegie-2017]|uniref:activating transcription factor 7-interacting protein 1-like isoform X2 n=1 Tax=Xenia sp. Carnegie-2017 TaxID=2897299 RepID=UPI001F04DCE4|nr:activating transcription factor 7-interacting protein 1-like isoform X2 [Xenia sp. Carnegie-2017]